jgi:hypothetical protein
MQPGISRPLIYAVISVLVVVLIHSSYSFSIFVYAVQINCSETGTLTVTCCQDHVINRSPSNPAGTLVTYCTDCDVKPGGSKILEGPYKGLYNVNQLQNCGERYIDVKSEQPPTSSPFDPTAPLQGGVLEQQQQTPPTSAPGASLGVLEQLEQDDGFSPGFLERQQQPPADQGATELPPIVTPEETQPVTVEEEQPAPVCQEGLEFNEGLGFCAPEDCQEGQVLDEESGICVLEGPEAAEEEEPEQQSPPEEQDQQRQPSEEESSEENSN